MNKQLIAPHKLWRKYVLWIILVPLATALILASGWRLYRDNNPQSYIAFTQYAPTTIADNLQISKKALEVWTSSVFTSLSPYSVDVVLSLNRSDSYIIETMDKNPSYSVCSDIGVTCTNLTTSDGQPYQLVLYLDPSNPQTQPLLNDKLTTQQVVFVKNGTRIQINIENKNATAITEKEWGDMVDSFKPTTFKDLHVKHMQPGP